MRPTALLALCVLAGCTVGAPPGFSSGDSWSAPLVGPLEGGPLLVPVKVHDKGPYLFLIDPDAPVSHVDEALASELELHSTIGGEYVDETDKARALRLAEVLRIQIGTLTVRNKTFWVMGVGAFNHAGRQVRGVIGRDILADSLVFGFDRKRGMAYLATQKGFTSPEGGAVVDYRLEKTRLATGFAAVSRRLTHATINGKQFTVHIDLGAVDSQLRESKWGEAGLVPVPLQRDLVDEAGTHRQTTTAAVGQNVALGGAQGGQVLFVPYEDRRWSDQILDGTIGLNFFSGTVVWLNFDDKRLYLSPEATGDLTKERIDRWGSAVLSACAVPACTTAKLLVPETAEAPPAAEGEAAVPAPAPVPAGQPILHIERSAEVKDLAFEVLIEAQSAEGVPAGLPHLLAIFPAGETTLTQALDDSFAGATFAVIDVDPFPRACAKPGACAYLLGPQ
jgi:hypothetical protein